jgi:hypothetical protein
MIADLQARINSTVALLVLSILKLVAALIIVIHFFACAWYWIGGMDTTAGWVVASGLDAEPFTSKYILCFQWSLRQFHPGKVEKRMAGEGTNTERSFEIITALTGLAVASTFVSSITNTMAQLQRVREEKTRHLRVVSEYSRAFDISNELSMRAKKYVKHRLEGVLRSTYEAELLQLLPTNMLMDMHYEARAPVLGSHRYFDELHQMNPTTLRRLCHYAVSDVNVPASSNAFSIGTVCNHMLFVGKGTFSYVRGIVDEDRSEAPCESERDLENSSHMLVRFRRARQSCMSCCTLCCPRTKLPKGDSDDNLDEGVSLQPGQWLCEAVLWTSTWEHVGTLRAETDGHLVAVGAEQMIGIVRESPRAWVDAAVYAKTFLQQFRDHEYMRSDLIQIASWDVERMRLFMASGRNRSRKPTFNMFHTATTASSPGAPGPGARNESAATSARSAEVAPSGPSEVYQI